MLFRTQFLDYIGYNKLKDLLILFFPHISQPAFLKLFLKLPPASPVHHAQPQKAKFFHLFLPGKLFLIFPDFLRLPAFTQIHFHRRGVLIPDFSKKRGRAQSQVRRFCLIIVIKQQRTLFSGSIRCSAHIVCRLDVYKRQR